MVGHRALIIGAGRIGCGYDWPKTPFLYTHADAYRTLKGRVKLVGVVEPDLNRLTFAEDKYKVKGYVTVEEAIQDQSPDVISICTPPQTRQALYETLASTVKRTFGLWIEKPLACQSFASINWKFIPKVVVNYIRRFDALHRTIKGMGPELRRARLIVHAKRDVHTVCHFADLARFWGIPSSNLEYVTRQGPCSYQLVFESGNRIEFPHGGVSGDFMTDALHNLLDAMDEKSKSTDSPVGNAIDSERWAEEILNAS